MKDIASKQIFTDTPPKQKIKWLKVYYLLSVFEAGEVQQAGKHMALMDRKFSKTRPYLKKLSDSVRDIQNKNFARQVAQANSFWKYQYYFYGLIVLIVGCVTIYGRFISRSMRSIGLEKENYMQELNQKELALAEKNQDLLQTQTLLQQKSNRLEETGKLLSLARDQAIKSKEEQEAIALELKIHLYRTAAIVDNVVDGIITIDSKGIIESFNIIAENIFGYKEKEMLGKNVSLLMPEPYASEHDQYLSKYMQTNVPNILANEREVEGVRVSGETFPMELAANEVYVEGKQFFVGVVRDVTNKKAQDDLAQ